MRSFRQPVGFAGFQMWHRCEKSLEVLALSLRGFTSQVIQRWLNRPNGNELHTTSDASCLKLVTGLEMQCLTNGVRNHDLKIR